MDTAETKEWVDRARAGDRAAWDALVARYHDRLLATIRSRVGNTLGRRVEPEDLVQESFLQALRSLERFQWHGESAFFRWLCGIARNAVLKAASRSHRGDLLELPLEVESLDPSPSRLARRGERFDRLREAIEKLSPDHREVILLSRIDGLRVREIAARMNRSEDAVMQLLTRALRRLRDEFGDTESLRLPERSLREEGFEPDGEPLRENTR